MQHPPHPFLDGLRVLDLTRLLPGPFCTMLLADMGANVIKIEDTRGGDYARYYAPFDERGHGALFGSINRNKKGVALDLKHPDGASVLRDLVASADVLVESFRPGVMERLGCGYEELAKINPALVYCAITGYGQDGPMSARAGHDLNYLALSGVLEQNGASGQEPVAPGFQLADIAGGALYAALGITSALYGRERTGQGAFLDISMTEGALSFHIPTHAHARHGDVPVRGQGLLSGGVPCYGVYTASDGRCFAVGSLEPKFWVGLLGALGLPELASDGLDTGEAGEAVREKLARVFATKTRDEWTEILAAVDVCCEPVLTPTEALDATLFRAREMFFTLQNTGYTRTPLSAVTEQGWPAPTHGEHTDEILSTVRGEDQIARLRDAGAIK